MANIELNIVALGDFSSVNAQIKALQAQVALLQQGMSGIGVNSTLSKDLANISNSFKQTMVSTGQFTASTVQMTTETEKFGAALQKGSLGLGNYFNIIANKTSSATSSVKALAVEQTKLQNSVIMSDPTKQGFYSVFTPTTINAVANATKIAANEQNIYNIAVEKGSQALINWGKNTQWAGRQLTVGMSMPLILFGQQAVSTFDTVNKALTQLQKVYGEGLTPPSQNSINQISQQVLTLGRNMASTLGITQEFTVQVAASFAAMGKMGDQLTQATEQTVRLAKLGNLDQQTATSAVIALQNVYKLNTTQLADAVNYFGAIQKQTSLSMNDLVSAESKVGPVIDQLGGSYKDTSVMLLAMKEAGVPAAQAANALKSAFGSIIAPTAAANKEFQSFGINLSAIKDAGGPVQMIQALQASLQNLSPLVREQLIEKLFGKYQFSRISALIDNFGKVGSQTANAIKVAGATSSQLQDLANQEIAQATSSPSAQWTKAMATIKADLYPVGQKIVEFGTKILEFGNGIAKLFQGLPGPVKAVMGALAVGVALSGPIIMLTGLFANFVGYIVKGIFNLKQLATGGKTLGQLLTPELIAAQNANKLFADGIASDVDEIDLLNNAIKQLTVSMQELVSSMNAGAGITSLTEAASALSAVATAEGAIPDAIRNIPFKAPGMATGGFVPGVGNSDSVPAMLMPGEAVIPKAQAQKYGPFISTMISGRLPGYAGGTEEVTGGTFTQANYSNAAMYAPGNTSSGGFGMDPQWLASSPVAPASWKATLNALMMSKANMRITQKTYAEFSAQTNSFLGELFTTFQNIASDSKNIYQHAQERLPVIVEQIKAAESEGRITAQQSVQMQEAATSLLNPPQSERTGSVYNRNAIAYDENGQPYVSKIRTGRAYGSGIKAKIKNAFGFQTAQEGLTAGIGQSGTSDYQYSHMTERSNVRVVTEPAAIPGKTEGTEAQKALAAMINSGKPISVGTKIQVSPETLASAKSAGEKIATTVSGSVNENLGVKSPSQVTAETGKQVDAGLAQGMTENVGLVEEAATKVADTTSQSLASKMLSKTKNLMTGNAMGGGVAGGMGAGMTAMAMGQMASPMLAKIPGIGGAASAGIGDASSAFGLAMMIPGLQDFAPEIAGVAAALGVAGVGIKDLMKLEKLHAQESKADFTASSDAAQFFGNTVQNTTVDLNGFSVAFNGTRLASAGFNQQMAITNTQLANFEKMVKDLPTDNPLSLVITQLKSMSNSGDISRIANEFVQMQVAIGNIKPEQAQQFLNLILDTSNHSQLVGTVLVTFKSQVDAISKSLQDAAGSTTNFQNVVSQLMGSLEGSSSLAQVNAIIAGLEASGYNGAAGINALENSFILLGNKAAADAVKALSAIGMQLSDIMVVVAAINGGATIDVTGKSPAQIVAEATKDLGKQQDANNAKTDTLKKQNAVLTSQNTTTTASLDLLKKKKAAIDAELKQQQLITSELQKQNQFNLSQADLDDKIRLAQASGDFMQASLIQQQKNYNAVDYAGANKTQQLQNQSDALNVTITAMEDKIAANNATISANNQAVINNTNSTDKNTGALVGGGKLTGLDKPGATAPVTTPPSGTTVPDVKNPGKTVNATGFPTSSVALATGHQMGVWTPKAGSTLDFNGREWKIVYVDGDITYATDMGPSKAKPGSPGTSNNPILPPGIKAIPNPQFSQGAKALGPKAMFPYFDKKTGYEFLTIDNGAWVKDSSGKTIGQWAWQPLPGGDWVALAQGGQVAGPGSWTSDSIPAMLSNGEFVTNAASVSKYGVSFMNSINNGTYKPSIPNMAGAMQMTASGSAGGSVYNITVNAETNASADDIANTVLATIERRNKMTSTNRRISV